MNRFKTRMEMSLEYGVDRKTFRSLLIKFKIQLPKGLISPASQRFIYDLLGKNDLKSSSELENL